MKQIALRVNAPFATAIKKAAKMRKQGEAEFMREAITIELLMVLDSSTEEVRSWGMVAPAVREPKKGPRGKR